MTSPEPTPSDRARVLVVDDELGIRESLRLVLARDYEVFTASGGHEALDQVGKLAPDLVLLDIMMPDLDGIAVLQGIRQIQADTIVVMLTAITSINTVVEAMRVGAEDYVSKPFEIAELRHVLERALERRSLRAEVARLRGELAERFRFDRIIGRSRLMRAIYEIIEQVADRRSTVLIYGESGTGKELVARAVHFTGARKERPFVVVNCAAIPETLLESQLFGHERGAFTDAHERRVGQFEAADGGTLFLDEIGEMPLAMQSKLLRVLQDREVFRVGSNRAVKVDVRIIAATNKELEQAIRDAHFRQDLYYRLNVVPIVVPPLRERREDIPLLVEHFLAKYVEKDQQLELSPEAVDVLAASEWPGNVRELENTIERLVALAPEKVVLPEHLPARVRGGGQSQRLHDDVLAGRTSLTSAVEVFERDLILEALRMSGGIQSRAARRLGISRRMLKYRMDKLGIPVGDPAAQGEDQE